MADANSVIFKVYLMKEGNLRDIEPEVRRFGIDKDVVTSYMYLREKLQTVFPGLRGKHFTVSWKDADQDTVVISSDEELQIALTETQNVGIRKLYVVLHSEYASGAQSSERGPNAFAIPESGPSPVKVEGREECPFENIGRRVLSGSCPEASPWLENLAAHWKDWSKNRTEDEQTVKQAEPHVEFLKNIGDNIAQLLNPLGIDVNIQAKSDKNAPGSSGQGNKK